MFLVKHLILCTVKDGFQILGVFCDLYFCMDNGIDSMINDIILVLRKN